MYTLYDRIISLCKLKGVTGSRMCLDLGLSKSTMSEMKAGRTKGLTTNTAQKIASYFGVSVGYLLGEEEKEKKPDIKDDERLAEFINLFTKLSPEQQDFVILQIKGVLSNKKI